MSELFDERRQLETVPFSVTARTAMQLGRESISSSIVAVLELVKNAYDADAENLRIDFANDVNTNKPILVIDDDGQGMTFEQLKNSWMVIGVNDKLLHRRSANKNRVRIGEKGLGRLGLDRLCETTSIQTFTTEEKQGHELLIDWRKYENNYGRLEDVLHKLFALPNKILENPINHSHEPKIRGTRLILSGLKDNWLKGYKETINADESDDSLLRKLQSELSLLVSPFASLNDFSITLRFDNRIINVRAEEILDAAEWKLEARLISPPSNEQSKWMVDYKLYRDDKLYSSYLKAWDEALTDDEARIPECGELEFIMYFIPRQETVGFSQNQVRSFMNANQGIRIYRDQFRVKPYGDPSGQYDWLGLNLNRVRHPTSRGQKGWSVAYNQVVGAVFIERDRNNKLLDQTNREGLVDSSAFDDMRSFTINAIEWFEREDIKYSIRFQPVERMEKAKVLAQVSTEETEDVVQEFESELNEALETIGLSIDSGNASFDEVKQKISSRYTTLRTTWEKARFAQDEMKQAYEEKTSALEIEKDTLSNLASLGILVVSFGHETKYFTNLVMTNAAILSDDISSLLPSSFPEIDKRILSSIEDLIYGAERIDTFAEFTLKNVRRDKRKRVNVYLDKVIARVMGDFEMFIHEKMNIDIDLMLQKVPPIKAFLIDWESILVNFITNSVWALDAVPKGKKKIRVKLYRENNNLHLLFADSGRGISGDVVDRVFEPTFTTKRNKEGEKWGTGMGLAIVENFVKFYSGSINAEAKSDLGGAQFHITIPAYNGKKG